MLDFKLDELMSKVKKGQMERKEYEYISKLLGKKNFLVFGTGYDTDFWRLCNKDGFNLFLEHDQLWIPKNSEDVHLVSYNTDISKYQEYLEDLSLLEMTLPNSVLETNWDVIFVDGPPGNKKTSFGRMQSIFTAWKLSNHQTDIFVHDCDRTVEDIYTKHFFNITCELVKLRHCSKKHL
jgi:hypothetical protein